MGFFGSVLSFVADTARSVGRAVVNGAKVVAAKVINFCADSAQKIVGSVKKAWAVAKPILQKAQLPLKALAEKTASIPYLGPIIKAVSLGLDGLFALENSPILKKVEQAINQVVSYAKKLEEEIKEGQFAFLSREEYEDALKAKEAFDEVEVSMSQEGREQFEVARAINELGIALADVESAIAEQPEDFEHYLRLRATQKLLNMQRKKVVRDGSFSEMSADDWFLIRAAADLIKKNPELSADAAERIDGILQQRFGKSLQSFVYEEIIANWELEARERAKKLKEMEQELAKMKVKWRNLDSAMKIQGELDAEELKEMQALERGIPVLESDVKEARDRKLDIETFTNAAEGFLQVLERSEEELIAMGRGYVIEKGQEVGAIIIKAADSGVHFSELSYDEQETVRYFSQIFSEDAARRLDNILEVEAA